MTTRPSSELLPADAREILQRAASVPVTKGAPLARTKAIEQANKKIRAMYPNFFIIEKE